MKLSVLSLFLLVWCSAGVAAGDSAELQALLTPISTLQANFSQTIKSEQGRLLQQLSGKVWLKKPAQFRWEVLGAEHRLIVSDGKTVWDFDSDLDQVTIQKLNTAQIQAPIFFLTGEVETLNRDFRITRLSSKRQGCLQDSTACFELRPKKEAGSFQWIRIGFKDKQLREMELLDQLGQKSYFSFTGVKLNAALPGSKFIFIPPKGVDILHNE